MLSPLISELIGALQTLPSVGPKTAQRLALHILEKDRAAGKRIADALDTAIESVKQCTQCRILCESALCTLCSDQTRDQQTLCIVENPGDVFAIEQSGEFFGLYFVIYGQISPLDGVGPEQLGFDQLFQLVASKHIKEVILAVNPTIEGEVTCYYLTERLGQFADIQVTRIAHGVPLGSDLTYIDAGTLVHALKGRQSMGESQ